MWYITLKEIAWGRVKWRKAVHSEWAIMEKKTTQHKVFECATRKRERERRERERERVNSFKKVWWKSKKMPNMWKVLTIAWWAKTLYEETRDSCTCRVYLTWGSAMQEGCHGWNQKLKWKVSCLVIQEKEKEKTLDVILKNKIATNMNICMYI